jgi:hypothetical protein
MDNSGIAGLLTACELGARLVNGGPPHPKDLCALCLLDKAKLSCLDALRQALLSLGAQ